MPAIKEVHGREILDSRGNPTVEVTVILSSGSFGRMMVPSGASTGTSEALELRDGDPERYEGKGVSKAIQHVNGELAQQVIGMNVFDQQKLDEAMIRLDGTDNKSRLGANAILGVSFAIAHAAAAAYGKPLYRYLASLYGTPEAQIQIPIPMVNMISGGLHAGRKIDLQDFLVYPIGAESYPEALVVLSRLYRSLQKRLKRNGYESHLLADEGGFGPALPSNQAAMDMICEAAIEAGMEPGKDIAFALDVASSHFYVPESGRYFLKSEERSLSSREMVDLLASWVRHYPILSIEDGLAEEDWEGWQELTRRMGANVQLVGDDLYTTNPERIRKGIESGAGNSVLVKMNQIGTLTETVQAVELARKAGFTTVISARSGETEDSTLADLAVGIGGGQIKIGSIAGSSRLSKYNQLLRIDQELQGRFAGRTGLGRFGS
jgi:enolase